jgi:isocitrate dehydrogenase
MRVQTLVVMMLAAGVVVVSGCATVRGNVFKQTDGTYKATFSARTEREALSVVSEDAKITCKKEEKTEKFMVVDQKAESMTQKTEGKTEGFAAVAGSAVSLYDKMTGSENYRATLIFKCEK